MEAESTPIVPAQRLLEVAAALSDGAARMHAQLRDLDPARRDALLTLMTDQIATMVGLWTELVRGVVSVESTAAGAAGAATGVLGRSERRGPVPNGWDADHPAHAEPQPVQAGPRPPLAEARSARPEPQPVPPEPLQALPEMHVVKEQAGGSAHRRHSPPPPPAPADDADRLTRDELTGVLNRPAGMAALHREIDRSRQQGTRFVLGYLNVDGLRHVNDTQGPRAGDELLRKVTAALRATLRSYDVILRLGGDEFLFSLPGADLATAEQRLREFGVILGEESPGATASVGFAELRDGDVLDDLIARADHALVAGRRPRRRTR